MASPRERDHRGEIERMPSRLSDARPVHHPVPAHHPVPVHQPAPAHYRRRHFHDFPPWPHRHHGDYALVEGWGWWPRWYPYWDPQWYAYWWSLYDYYGGDAYPDYAANARDAFLRANASRWGLAVGNYYGASYGGNYYGTSQVGASHGGSALVGIQPYGVSPVVQHHSTHKATAYRATAAALARQVYSATGRLMIGYRDSPWGSETTMFGTRAGLQRWANEQAADPHVWYAAAFSLTESQDPLSEVVR